MAFKLIEQEKYTFQKYAVDSSNATAIFVGDLVTQENDGNVTPSTAGDAGAVLGVVSSVLDSNGAPIKYLPASTAGYVVVALAQPGVRFLADASGSFASTDIGATADHTVGAGGSTFSGLSSHALDATTLGTGQQCRVLEVTEDNKLVVAFTESAFLSNTSI